MSGQQQDPLSFEVFKPGSAPDELGRRRMHRWTPLVQGAQWWPAALIAGFTAIAQAGVSLGGGALIIGAAGVLAIAVIGVGWAYLEWQRRWFWFDDDGDLRVDSGVLSRNQRRLQLSRLQSVDVLQPLVPRLVGLAELRVEVAGAGDSKVNLQYLTLAEANALRNEIVARSAGVRHDAEEAPESLLATVPPGDLLVSLLLRAETFGLLVMTVVVFVVTFWNAGPAGLAFLLVGGVPIFGVFAQFSRYYDFTVAESPDGLRLRHGLLQKTRQTVPPGRVQAVGFVQPFLWRRRDWVRVRLNVAGVSSRNQGSGDQSFSENVLLPVAPWPVALAIVQRVLPGVDLTDIPWQAAPERSRKRAWIQWRQLAVAWDDQVFITRSGRIVERWDVVPHARTQSVRVTQGPWQRSLGLASMHVDSTPGAVKITGHHRDAVEARLLAQQQADRAAAARASDTSLRWIGRHYAGEPGSDVVPQPPEGTEPGGIEQL
ncbi:MAG TPA: PH domain-containing protein [Candidatus Nanopelagicales bacterium]|nr:PH domain-containing protein [Candidatus Nanopelagicales bacterium]